MAKKILIADDDADSYETARIRLEAQGYSVTGTMGEATIKDARDQKPDLLLLDVMMPGMDGYSVMRELKRDPDTASIPVVILSGKPKEAMMELFGPEGVSGYITKPYDPKEFISQVQALIGK